jgi:2-oxoglutarate dehydrogenase E2 component (dihydrolipoamide succinyltransferase)
VAPAAGSAPTPAPPPPQANAPTPPPLPPASAQPAPAPPQIIAQVTNTVSGAPAAVPTAGTPIATGIPPRPSRPPSRRR